MSAFRTALARGDARSAYALLSQDAQARITQAEFETQLRENPLEAKELQRDLAKLGPAVVRAQVPAENRTMELILDPRSQEFRIDSRLTDFYPRETPRQALRSFLRAVESSRWDVLLTLMPEADRHGLDAETLGRNLSTHKEELTRIVALLKTAQEAPIEIVGDRATMPYGESYTARFLREEDGWKVEDPE